MTEHASEDLISQWLDRELDSEQAGRIEEHLKGCQSCRTLESELSDASRLFRGMEPAEPPPYLWTRIAAQLQSDTREEKHNLWRSLLQRDWLRTPVLATAAALLLTIAGTLAYVEHLATVRAQVAAIAEIDRAHSALMVLNTKTYNPFHEPTEVDAGANPFAPVRLKDQPNPFRTPPARP